MENTKTWAVLGRRRGESLTPDCKLVTLRPGSRLQHAGSQASQVHGGQGGDQQHVQRVLLSQWVRAIIAADVCACRFNLRRSWSQ